MQTVLSEDKYCLCLEVDFSIVKKCWTNEKIQDEKNRLVYQLESILPGMGRIELYFKVN